MKTLTFFRKHLLYPIILFFAILSYLYLSIWNTGLQYSFGRGISWLVSLGFYALIFLTIGIITIVRLVYKKKTKNLLITLWMQVFFGVFFWSKFYQEMAFRLNIQLYQHDREEVVKLIQDSKLIPADTTQLNSDGEMHRNVVYDIPLPKKYENTSNLVLFDSLTKTNKRIVTVSRNCEGELDVAFGIDEHFLGDKFAVLYSDTPPFSNYVEEETTGGGQFIAAHTNITVGKNSVEKTLKKKWYYVRIPDGLFMHMFDGMFNGLFNFGGGGGSDGGVSGGNAGGCN